MYKRQIEYPLDPLDKTSADQLVDLADLAALSLAKRIREDSPLGAITALASITNRQISPDASSKSVGSVDGNPASRMEAAVMQAEILSELRQYQAAAKQYDAIAEDFASMKFGGKTGAELRAGFMAAMTVRNVDLRTRRVPDGEVKITRINEPQDRSTASLRYRAVNLRSFSNPRLANHEFFVDFQLETLILHDGFGVAVDSWSLGPKNLRPARSNLLPHAHEVNGVLVLALPYEIIAIDTFTDDENDAVLWRMDIPATSQSASNYNFQGLGAIDRKTPVPFSYLGSVTHAEVCFLRGSDLECRDLLTGKLRWVQRSQSTRPGTVVFGDQHFTCSNKQKTITTTGLANVFETATGRPLATGAMPGRHSLLATSGRLAIQFFGQFSSGNDFAVGAVDPATGSEIWKFDAEKQSRVCFVDHDELALFEPSGEFHVIRMSDGEILLEGSALPEKKLIGIVVKKTPDNYILATKNQPPRTKYRTASYLPRTQLDGKIYGYDRKTGKAQWDEVKVDNFDMMMLPNELPFIFFAKKISANQNAKQKESTRFAVLDTRTGKFVVHEELPATESFTQSTFDPVLKELSLATQRTAIKLRPTSVPRSKPDPKIPKNLEDSTAATSSFPTLRPGVPIRPGVPFQIPGINR